MTSTSLVPVDLLSALPRLLGGVPHDSVVAIALEYPTGALSCVQVERSRCTQDPGAPQAIAWHLRRTAARTVVLVSFTDEDVRVSCPAIDALAAALDDDFEEVLAYVVQRDKYFVPGCFGDCCPPHGNPLPMGLEFVGLQPYSSTSFDSHEADAAAQRWRRRWRGSATDLDRAARMWDRALVRKAPMTGATAGRLAAALDDLRVRDYVVLRMFDASSDACAAVLDGGHDALVGQALGAVLDGTAAPRTDRIAHMTRVIDQTIAHNDVYERAALETLGALLAWWDGRLGPALDRAERALMINPDYRLAELVELAASRGVAPGRRTESRRTDKSGEPG